MSGIVTVSENNLLKVCVFFWWKRSHPWIHCHSFGSLAAVTGDRKLVVKHNRKLCGIPAIPIDEPFVETSCPSSFLFFRTTWYVVVRFPFFQFFQRLRIRQPWNWIQNAKLGIPIRETSWLDQSCATGHCSWLERVHRIVPIHNLFHATQLNSFATRGQHNGLAWPTLLAKVVLTLPTLEQPTTTVTAPPEHRALYLPPQYVLSHLLAQAQIAICHLGRHGFLSEILLITSSGERFCSSRHTILQDRSCFATWPSVVFDAIRWHLFFVKKAIGKVFLTCSCLLTRNLSMFGKVKRRIGTIVRNETHIQRGSTFHRNFACKNISKVMLRRHQWKSFNDKPEGDRVARSKPGCAVTPVS